MIRDDGAGDQKEINKGGGEWETTARVEGSILFTRYLLLSYFGDSHFLKRFSLYIWGFQNLTPGNPRA